MTSFLCIFQLYHPWLPKAPLAQPAHAAFGIPECPHSSRAQGVPGRALSRAAPRFPLFVPGRSAIPTFYFSRFWMFYRMVAEIIFNLSLSAFRFLFSLFTSHLSQSSFHLAL